jgi:Mg-chelatase subunit ChlD
MTLFTNIMQRLGLEVFGSNEDLSMIPSDSDKPKEPGDPGDSEDGDEDTEPGDGDGDSDDDSDSDEDGEGKGKGKGDDSDSDSDSDDGEGEGDSDEDSDEDSDDGDDGDDDGDDPSDGVANENLVENINEGDTENGDSDDPTAGGHSDIGDKAEFLTSLVDALVNPETAGLKDTGEGLADATNGERNEDDVEDGESIWRPYDPEADTVVKPRGDKARAEAMRKQAKLLTASLRTQFRAKFLRERVTTEIHGVKKGRGLSERRLVDSFIEIKSGVRPERPDFRIRKKNDVSLAVAVVGDESGSMAGYECQMAATAMIAIAEAFDTLGAPVMCCGPRDGSGARSMNQEPNHNLFHRRGAVRIDLFKDWNEPFRSVKSRFAAYTATGGTPLSDGVQYAMQELNLRPERHRVILVLTDGCPNNARVMKRQIRLAAEAGIYVIGVGICGAEYYVPKLFPIHVLCPTLTDLPKDMMEVISNVVFPKRGKKVELDGLLGGRKARRRHTG